MLQSVEPAGGSLAAPGGMRWTQVPLRRRHPIDILVIEADPASRRTAELALGHLGYLVISAGSLEGARALLKSFVVDAILCDLQLPDGMGMDLLADVKACPTPVATVVMSGDPEALHDRAVRHSFEQGVTKPIDFARLDRWLRQRFKHN